VDLASAERFLEQGGYRYVRFEQADLHGVSRSKTVPENHVRHFVENGLNFFGGLLGYDLQSGVAPGTGYMEEVGFQDHLLRADLDTLAPVSWIPNTARVIGDPYWYSGKPAAASPRHILARMLAMLADAGYDLESGFEYEFYLVEAASRRPVFPGKHIFWSLRNDFDPAFTSRLHDCLRTAGVDMITSNAEYGPGQMEINWAPARGLKAADTAYTFKNAVKEIAALGTDGRKFMASFMTKPYPDQSASGCHFHQSLWRIGSGANAFSDEDASSGISQVAGHWIGGQLAHAKALAALVAPTVNCAKRFKLWSFAPMNVSWGFEDRTCAVRVKGGRGVQTRLENRMACAASNPYVVGAGMVAAGLDGLARELEPPPLTTEVAYLDDSAEKLPTTLDEALGCLEQDEILRGYLGDEFVRLFLAVKRFEVETARDSVPEYGSADWLSTVTDWERDNLFEQL
jgi:glutamine synthetase